MTLVIGIDEAGYGPNLGPLVIGSSSWQIDELQCDHLSTKVADQFIQLQNDYFAPCNFVYNEGSTFYLYTNIYI